MGQILKGSATTTEAVRRAIQHSQESVRALARRHGINPKTVAKWKRRESTADRRTGPSVPKSTVLSVEQEAIIVAFRKHTLIARGVFTSVHDLARKINRYLKAYSANAKPIQWKYSDTTRRIPSVVSQADRLL